MAAPAGARVGARGDGGALLLSVCSAPPVFTATRQQPDPVPRWPDPGPWQLDPATTVVTVAVVAVRRPQLGSCKR
jgi:hypothetical protein